MTLSKLGDLLWPRRHDSWYQAVFLVVTMAWARYKVWAFGAVLLTFLCVLAWTFVPGAELTDRQRGVFPFIIAVWVFCLVIVIPVEARSPYYPDRLQHRHNVVESVGFVTLFCLSILATVPIFMVDNWVFRDQRAAHATWVERCETTGGVVASQGRDRASICVQPFTPTGRN